MQGAEATSSRARPIKLGSEAVTRGVRVRVEPRFIPDQSDPDEGRYVFAYRVAISNEGAGPVKLLSRRWLIIDADGKRNEVEGEGVVGQQPRIEPGGVFEYASWAPLEKPWGTMEGAYTFRAETGETFEAQVARFYLAADAAG